MKASWGKKEGLVQIRWLLACGRKLVGHKSCLGGYRDLVYWMEIGVMGCRRLQLQAAIQARSSGLSEQNKIFMHVNQHGHRVSEAVTAELQREPVLGHRILVMLDRAWDRSSKQWDMRFRLQRKRYD